MAFIAHDRQTNQRIDITQIEQPRATLKQEDLICQLCGQAMIIKAGMVRRPHFAHKGTQCDTDYQFHPESPSHHEAKLFLVQHLSTVFTEYTSAQFQYEIPIPEIRRVADILVEFPMGWRIAHEIQLAAITLEELQERTTDYERAGIDVYWWLGHRANTEINRRWCEETFGYALTIYEEL